MQLDKKLLRGNAIVFGIFGLLSLVFGLPGLGAMAIIYSIGNLLVSLIFLVKKEYSKLQTSLLISGILLLIGFGLCTSFQLNFH